MINEIKEIMIDNKFYSTIVATALGLLFVGALAGIFSIILLFMINQGIDVVFILTSYIPLTASFIIVAVVEVFILGKIFKKKDVYVEVE